MMTRRNLLKSAALAGATLPLVRLNSVIDQWRHTEYGDIPQASGHPVVRLSHNENPFGPSDRARKAIIEAISKGNRYPREAQQELKKKIADYEGLESDQILLAAGSTELLGVAGLMAGIEKGRVISCHPTFSFLLAYASQFAAEWVKVPMTADHHYNLAGINEQLNGNTKLVFICNPNNPTGTELPRSVLEPFCSVVSQRCMVYVDEAYIELAKEGHSATLAGLTTDNPNIIVARTFSKIYGMAGLRIGYAIAHRDTIQKLERLMMGGNVSTSVTSLAAAMASLGDADFISYCRQMNDQTKSMIGEKFNSWGVEFIPSSTNFIFFKTDRFGTKNLLQSLQEKNIMIRTYDDVPGWARVSMGTVEEIKTFLGATEELLV
jgi:histidinol-phosphate aminotransferase